MTGLRFHEKLGRKWYSRNLQSDDPHHLDLTSGHEREEVGGRSPEERRRDASGWTEAPLRRQSFGIVVLLVVAARSASFQISEAEGVELTVSQIITVATGNTQNLGGGSGSESKSGTEVMKRRMISLIWIAGVRLGSGGGVESDPANLAAIQMRSSQYFVETAETPALDQEHAW